MKKNKVMENIAMKMEKDQAPKEAGKRSNQAGASHFNLDLQGVDLLLTKGIDLNHFFVLEHVARYANLPEGPKYQDWAQTLVRKGFLTVELSLTLKGEQLPGEVSEGTALPETVYTKADDPFERWWSGAYPGTDAFEHKGRSFPGSQSKRWNKESCRKLFREAVNELKIDPLDIYWATLVQVENAMEKSLQTGTSEISHIPNSERYLKNRCFMPFLEAGRKRQQNPINRKTDPFSHII